VNNRTANYNSPDDVTIKEGQYTLTLTMLSNLHSKIYTSRQYQRNLWGLHDAFSITIIDISTPTRLSLMLSEPRQFRDRLLQMLQLRVFLFSNQVGYMQQSYESF
jgi:hypothetical protein